MLLTIPYDESMYLCQGFNSYTQSPRMYRAVEDNGDFSQVGGDPEKDPPLVSISSQFVTKISDVVGALGYSAASCIKAGNRFGGGLINLDKLVEADIILVLRVQATTETNILSDKTELVSVRDIGVSDFAETFGDTFISGTLVGGEFASVISLKVGDSTKNPEVKSQLESYIRALQTKTPTFHEFDIDGETEISISLRRRGGPAQLADSDRAWDIAGVFGAAARFPEACRGSHQCHSVILSPYTSLPSFFKIPSTQRKLPQYESARLYTSDLLDDYTDFIRHETSVRDMRLNPKSYTESSSSLAYTLDTAGMDSASLDIRKQMFAITCEVDRISKNPAVAEETLDEGRAVYIKPSVIASRLPVSARKVAMVSDAVNKSTSALLSDRPANAKMWKWVHVPGWDSPDNDVFKHGEGDVGPAEIMLKICEWETAHPGHFIRGFNLRGEVKSKVWKWQELKRSPPGSDLYVRVLYDDQWAFYPGLDSGGNDFETGHKFDHNVDIDIVEALQMFSARQDVAAFNSMGWAKNKVVFPLTPGGFFTGKPHLGVWVRKSALNM